MSYMFEQILVTSEVTNMCIMLAESFDLVMLAMLADTNACFT
jgi:hypothetical protein